MQPKVKFDKTHYDIQMTHAGESRDASASGLRYCGRKLFYLHVNGVDSELINEYNEDGSYTGDTLGIE